MRTGRNTIATSMSHSPSLIMTGLYMTVTAITDNGFGSQRYQLEPIPKDWFYTVQTLEGEINRELEELHKKHPNEYNKGKRPDVFEEKK